MKLGVIVFEGAIVLSLKSEDVRVFHLLALFIRTITNTLRLGVYH